MAGAAAHHSARVLAGLLALASVPGLAFGTFIALFGLGTLTQRPDPTVPDGDPCCGHPDTWGDVVIGGLYGLVALVGVGALTYVGWRLGHYAMTGRTPTACEMHRGWVATCIVMIACAAVIGPEPLTDSINGIPG